MILTTIVSAIDNLLISTICCNLPMPTHGKKILDNYGYQLDVFGCNSPPWIAMNKLQHMVEMDKLSSHDS